MFTFLRTYCFELTCGGSLPGVAGSQARRLPAQHAGAGRRGGGPLREGWGLSHQPEDARAGFQRSPTRPAEPRPAEPRPVEPRKQEAASRSVGLEVRVSQRTGEMMGFGPLGLLCFRICLVSR